MSDDLELTLVARVATAILGEFVSASRPNKIVRPVVESGPKGLGMCGFAGYIDLAGWQAPSEQLLADMANIIEHRGPDESGVFRDQRVGLASRRLSIIDLADGQQPVFNEDRSVVAVFNGEIYNHDQIRADLQKRGHVFRSRCDTEVLVHLWEEHGVDLVDHLRGQFAFAVYDIRKRLITLARDRVGICPLHWARVGTALLFGSEIKSLLASGLIAPELDVVGLDHIFTYFALPGERTMFRGVQALPPGHRLMLRLDHEQVEQSAYWDLDFPDAGAERAGNEAELVDQFDAVVSAAVERRTRADVPVVGYLSGGVDSATICAVAGKQMGAPLPAFTIKVCNPNFDEESTSRRIAETLGAKQTIVAVDDRKLQDAYAGVVWSAESPVVDTASSALYLLAAEVRRQGYKVALTGEGADEALAGYPWFKVNRLLNGIGWPNAHLGDWARRAVYRVATPALPWSDHRRLRDRMGGRVAQADFYSLMASSRRQFYRDELWDQLRSSDAIDAFTIRNDRFSRWSPLNQSIYLGYKTILPGLLLSQKGDRVALAHSVETRYPFLDEEFISFCSQLAPRWKLRGLLRDKWLLRRFARRLLPTDVADRPKAMFRAPFGNAFLQAPAPWIEQLLSVESLQKSGLFDAQKVLQTWEALRKPIPWPGRRTFLEMGMTGVISTQLWLHIYCHGNLCDLPAWSAPTGQKAQPGKYRPTQEIAGRAG